MAQTVKLADEIMALVRREARLNGRSLTGQVTHWLKIGRAIERSGSFDYARISTVLEGNYAFTRPHDDEENTWLDTFTKKMGHPTEAEEEFFGRRQSLGRGVGLDAGGNLVYAKRGTAG
ncbi:TA system antitoxin ParD family protein [Leisingera sp. ANG-M7]|uniref:TA system antitoxin ParD family protein n=1 Tax=Leisingera sp. ANG-M7 TaxID=1577902 RepID=UPI00057F3C96|nr:hypothetical protein [Leisingera sp. ANG-M7]KIC35716.1 hypothetical protein RA26_15520 [Leisingera sp. ANG-M7]